MPQPKDRRGRIALAGAALATAGALAVLLLDLFPIGVPGEWAWECRWTGRGAQAATPALALAVFVGCLWAALRKLRAAKPTRLEQAVLVALLVVFAGILQLSVAHLCKTGAGEWTMVTLAPWTNSYFCRAAQVHSAGDFLASYHERMASFEAHVRTHPPGGVLMYWAVIQFFRSHPRAATGLLAALDGSGLDPMPLVRAFEERLGPMDPGMVASAWVGSMVVLCACCATIVPVYALAKGRHGLEAGVVAGALVAVMPGMLLFTPATDQLLCPLAAGSVWLAVEGCRQRRPWLGAGAGAVWALALLVSLSALPLLFLIGLWALWSHWRRWRSHLLGPLAAFAAAACAVMILLRVATGFRPLAVYSNLLALAPQAARDAYIQRPAELTYWKWIGWNLVDVFLFAGPALCVLFVAGLRSGVSRFALAWVAMIVVLDLSGVTLGEVGRLWLPLFPLMAGLPAAVLVQCWPARQWPVAAALALQMAVAVALKLRMAWI